MKVQPGASAGVIATGKKHLQLYIRLSGYVTGEVKALT